MLTITLLTRPKYRRLSVTDLIYFKQYSNFWQRLFTNGVPSLENTSWEKAIKYFVKCVFIKRTTLCSAWLKSLWSPQSVSLFRHLVPRPRPDRKPSYHSANCSCCQSERHLAANRNRKTKHNNLLFVRASWNILHWKQREENSQLGLLSNITSHGSFVETQWGGWKTSADMEESVQPSRKRRGKPKSNSTNTAE